MNWMIYSNKKDDNPQLDEVKSLNVLDTKE